MRNTTKTRAARAESTINAYRRLFSTDDGKKVLKDLLKSCYFFGSVIGKDVHETYYNEGMRNVILRMILTAGMSENDILRMREQLLSEDMDVID